MSNEKKEDKNVKIIKYDKKDFENIDLSSRVLVENPLKIKSKENTEKSSKIEETKYSLENENFYSFYINNNIRNKNEYHFKNNKIDTTKYNIITFLPKAILFQFMRLANVYFLFTTILQYIPIISPLGSETALIGIVIVLSVSLIRELYEDCKKANLDKIQNSVKCKVYRNNTWIDIESGNLELGEIVIVEQDDIFPADLVLLDSSLPEGICYIETSSLDGEKTLKQKNPPNETIGKFVEENKGNDEKDKKWIKILDIEGECKCDKPNPELYNLNGKMNVNINGEIMKFPFDHKQLLLKGAKLKNTKWIIGLIIYAGHNCKIMKNTKHPRIKYSNVEKTMNYRLIFIFTTQCILSIISAIFRGFYYTKNLKNDNLMSYQIYSYTVESVLSFFTYLLILNTMIPISLIVTLEVVKMVQTLFLSWDVEGYSKIRKRYIHPNVSILNEELGFVDYIFTDKTGTLTCNKMVFKYCVIGDRCFQMIRDNKNSKTNEVEKMKEQNDIISFFQNDMLNPEKFDFSTYEKYIMYSEDKRISISLEKLSNIIKEYWLALALCHECSTKINEDGSEDYIGMSPDSIELIKAARYQGYQLTHSSSIKFRRIKILPNKTNEENNIKDFELLNIIPFSPERKRESVIVKENNIIKLYIKGADSIIEQRLHKDTNLNILEKCRESINYFSSQGYRTLLIGMKIISQEEYNTFSNNLKEANMSLENKEKKVEEIFNNIEQNLYLLGCTIVEDKLQDEVPQTIQDLRNADMKIWMLTGDKMNTAYNIGLSCNLISSNMKIFKLCGKEKKLNNKLEIINKEECDQIILDFAKEFNKFKGEFTSMEYNMNNSQPKNFGILIDENVLRTVNEDKEIQKIFLDIAKNASSVICCRVSPLQKSQVVKMVKNYNKSSITLAIGDGGNDVSMITEAHIGIGIYGEEGMRAVQASDYAIGEFKILNRLLLFHGRIFYIRNTQCILYFFYKNFVFTLVQFVYGFYTNFSGQTIIDDWYIAFYNLIFTALPLGARAIIDYDLRPEDGIIVKKMMPYLYAEIKRNPIFNTLTFFLYLTKGTIHCIINFYLTKYITLGSPIDEKGNMDCLWYTSLGLFTNIIFVVSIDLMINTANITWFNVVIMLGTTFVVYISFLIGVQYSTLFNSYASIYNSVISPIFWLNLILVSSACLIFDYSIKSINYFFKPNYSRELEIVYSRFGQINSTEKLSNNIIEKLNQNKNQSQTKSKL